MLKPLLKKQFLETVAVVFYGKDGKRRSPLALVGFALLMLYAFGAVGAMFWFISDMLCTGLVEAGLAWVYFAFMGIMATGFACIGSIFAAKAQLYEAKDNELLLSMPIKPRHILFSRTTGLYALAWFFSALVLVPATICYFTVVKPTALSVVFSSLILFIVPLGSLSVSCLLGWLIALVTARLRSKNFVTLVFTVAFLAVYFWLYSKMQDYLSYIVANGAAVGEAFQTRLFPFWQMGLAATGKGTAFLAFAGLFIGAFALVYLVMDKTFLRVVTQKKGGAKAKYKRKERKAAPAAIALFKKECARFVKNPMIALNCLLGSLFFLIFPVLALCNLDFCRQIAALAYQGELALIFIALLCFVSTMNMLTASSVSLEGETLWIVQSLPVEPWTVLQSKLAVHIVFTGAPALLCTLVTGVAIGLSVGWLLAAVVAVLAFILLCASAGLAINIKLPNLRWTSEIVAVKQGLSSLVAMLVEWGAAALFIGGYFLFGKYLSAWSYAVTVIAVLAVANAALLAWLKKRGAKIFANLS